MQVVIGLGKAGVNIARAFNRYPQYRVYTIDSENSDYINHFLFPKCETHEECEKKTPNLGGLFQGIGDNEEILFIVGGGGTISGASLAILQQLKQYKISLIYIKPDQSLLSETKCLQDRVTYNILQQYARSGGFERIILIDNNELDKIAGGAPVIGYYDKLNQVLTTTFHMINVFDHSEAVMSTVSSPLEMTRISTLGVFDTKKNEEKLFFPLTAVREKCYYFAVNEETLKTDKQLLKKITTQMKGKITNDKIKVSYGIYSTKYENNYGYILARSSLVQSDFSNTQEE